MFIFMFAFPTNETVFLPAQIVLVGAEGYFLYMQLAHDDRGDVSLRGSDQQEVNATFHFLLRTEKQKREGRRMDEIKRIKMSLHLLLVLIPFTVLAAQSSHIIVRAGAEVTLPCDNVRDDHVNCGATSWIFSDSKRTGTVNLFVNRQLDTSVISKSKADRLRLAANCSLVIREVTAEDAGQYNCIQFDLTTQTHEDHLVYLSVVNVTEQKRTDEVTLSCSVSTYERCKLTVKWLYMNIDVTEDNTELKTSQSSCSATVSFSKSHSVHKMKNYSSLTCKVRDRYKEEKFAFIPPSSGKNKPAPGNNEMTTDWWWYIALAVGFATIVIMVVILIRWRRNKDTQINADENITFSAEETKGFDEPDSSLCEANSSVPVDSGNKTQTDKNTVDPADDVAYASISHSPYSVVQFQGGDDAVIYSTVTAPSSSTGPSADPSSLYANVTIIQ
ncbi:uncharacterized protein LOC124851213 isoform X2 [Hippoglossus stenolepis]|uniref:uncharacterized protein LOC124851213 isoform X2 n=1 Tax=Hippoglossus stenolepis TaxID=195615 RepID=UPI001FAF8D56|nr:uncharacterized protein LOC124851213 isoform X2 [Hippoglossus stenolepis]